MSTLYITEYPSPGITSIPVPSEPGIEQVVTISASSAQSAALNPSTQFVRINSDVVCSIKVGTNPTAVITAHRVGAGVTEYFAVPLSSGYKIAVIANT